MTADTLITGWQQASLLDKREVVRLLVQVTVKRAERRGRNFDPQRVEIMPSALQGDASDTPGLSLSNAAPH
jgi:hypothetical protein